VGEWAPVYIILGVGPRRHTPTKLPLNPPLQPYYTYYDLCYSNIPAIKCVAYAQFIFFIQPI